MKNIFIFLWMMAGLQLHAQYWNEVPSGTQQQLFSISFANQQVGYIGGYDGFMLKTTNGGQTWNTLPQIALMNSFNDVIDLDFVNANTGYAIISNYNDPLYRGVVVMTIDGGQHWTQIDIDNVAAYCMHHFSGNNGFVAGAAFFTGYVINKLPPVDPDYYHYFQSNPTSFFKTIDFRNEQVGVAAGDNGLIARTFDGGLHWDTLTCQATDTTITSIKFLNDSTLLASCDNTGGTLLLSFDMGRTWHIDFNTLTFYYPVMKGLAVSKKDSFIAVGATITNEGKGMIYWHGGLQETAQRLRGVAMVNDSIAYAVGDTGIIVTNRITNTTGIHPTEWSEGDFNIYPNPNKGLFTVSSATVKHSLMVYNITGRLLFEDKKMALQHHISLKGNAAGIYIVQINVGNERWVKRISVE